MFKFILFLLILFLYKIVLYFLFSHLLYQSIHLLFHRPFRIAQFIIFDLMLVLGFFSEIRLDAV